MTAGYRVLVTGADGFIGSHLVERLVADGHDVTALCVYNSNGSHGWLDESAVRSDTRLVLGDVRDAGLVADVCDGVDLVFHLAALIAIPYSYDAPRSYVETNVVGTLNVLEATRRHGVARLVNTSTSEVYGTPDTTPITEDHPLKGQSPYSASKIAADKLCESYARSYDHPVVTLRPFNTYGPRQSRRAVIPTVLSQLLAGDRQLRLGALHPQRDFTYVADTVDGLCRIATADIEAGEVIQLGTGRCISIGDLVDVCCRVTGVEATVVTDTERLRPAASEVDILLSDPSKARERLGWKPTTDLADGLAALADHLADRLAHDPAGRLPDAQTYQR